MGRVLSVLIVGCGRIAGGFDDERKSAEFALSHAGAYRKDATVRLDACVDTNADIAEAFAQRWSVGQAYTHCDDIPDGSEFDVISICTPTSFHRSSVEKVLRFNPSVIFLEKPVSSSAEVSSGLLDQCREKGIALVVNYSRRWDRRLSGVRRRLENGELGSLRAVAGIYNKGIRNNGSHMLDALTEIVGPLTPEWVSLRPDNTRVEDPDVDAVLISREGVRCTLISTESEDFAQFELTFLTSQGEIRMLDGGLRWSERLAEDNPDFAGYKRLGNECDVSGDYFPVMERAVSDVIRIARSDASATSTDYRAAEQAVNVEYLIEQILDMTDE